MTRLGSAPWIAAVVSAGLGLAGCSADRPVVVATPWDRAACRDLASALRAGGDGPIPPIRWIRLDPWDDPARLLGAGRRVDLLVGWPGPTLSGLARRGLIDASDGAAFLGLVHPGDPDDDRPARRSFPAGDPRIDPVARAEVAARLARGDGRLGYAALLEESARGGPPATAAPTDPPIGAALVAGASHPEARPLLAIVRRRCATDPIPLGNGPAIGPAALAVLSAELIGATAIDAAPELRRAWAALGRSPEAARARAVLVEPPPWPPASVVRLRDDPARRPLLETLAAALVEDAGARSWLLDSWDGPPRPVDRPLLLDLAGAAEGRLIGSPRMLPWLRAEWSAWARQRYARIARELASEPAEVPR